MNTTVKNKYAATADRTGEFELELDSLLADFHQQVWQGCESGNDYDLAGNDQAEAIQKKVAELQGKYINSKRANATLNAYLREVFNLLGVDSLEGVGAEVGKLHKAVMDEQTMRAKYMACYAVLAALVRLKKHKEQHGKTFDYEVERITAWKDAERVVENECKEMYHPPAATKPTTLPEFKIGQMVAYEPPHQLVSGASVYDWAVVVNNDPLVLASETGDMRWESTVKPELLRVIGESSLGAFRAASSRKEK